MKNKTRLAAFKQLLLAGRGLIETAIGELKEICQIQRHGITRQTISWQGSWLMSSTQYIPWKNRLTGILLNVKLRLLYVIQIYCWPMT
ncbi:MAG: transposase [Candidatus Midichloria mitochondrii]|nr:transposase [Candidatus Midichloria mitochondrii]